MGRRGQWFLCVPPRWRPQGDPPSSRPPWPSSRPHRALRHRAAKPSSSPLTDPQPGAGHPHQHYGPPKPPPPSLTSVVLPRSPLTAVWCPCYRQGMALHPGPLPLSVLFCRLLVLQAPPSPLSPRVGSLTSFLRAKPQRWEGRTFSEKETPAQCVRSCQGCWSGASPSRAAHAFPSAP